MAACVAEADRFLGEAERMESVRLVIWDLDDTFWQGTLTEGGVAYSPDLDRPAQADAKSRWRRAGRRKGVTEHCSLKKRRDSQSAFRLKP